MSLAVSAPVEVQSFVLEARASLVGAVSLKWDSQEESTKYVVQIKNNETGSFINLAEVSSTFYRVVSLEQGKNILSELLYRALIKSAMKLQSILIPLIKYII
ncbi:hypothetical protein GCM10028895_01570 [Pontibacter rugosus]